MKDIIVKLEKLEELTRQAKRFSCQQVQFINEGDIVKYGIAISKLLSRDDCVFTVDNSGTKFFNEYIKPFFVNKNVGRINVFDESVVLPPNHFNCRRVVVIDDAITTGNTLRRAFRLLSERTSLNPNQMKIFCISSTVDVIDIDSFPVEVCYLLKVTSDTYVAFPWEL